MALMEPDCEILLAGGRSVRVQNIRYLETTELKGWQIAGALSKVVNVKSMNLQV